MELYLGLDIGGSSIKYGVGTCEQGLLSFDAVPVREKSLPEFQSIFSQIKEAISSNFGWDQIQAIGIGTPGQVDHKQDKLIGVNPNLPFWTGISPRLIVSEDVALPVFYDNDANLMTLGEALRYPAGSIVVGVTIGSGIGCGLVSDGRIFRGSRGFALDLGHVTCVHNGSPCNCGKRGCLEAYASLNGMRNRLSERGYKSIDMGLLELLMLVQNDDEAKTVLFEGIEHFSIALSNLIVITEPDYLILGGGGSELQQYPLQELISRTYALLPAILAEHIGIEKAHYGNKAGVLGAIALAQNGLSCEKPGLTTI